MTRTARAASAALPERAIPDYILEVLGRMTVEGNVLLEYTERLPPDRYKKLNEVLTALGGKWSKSKPRGHHFADDPSERIAAVLATGSYACPRLAGYFQTPEWLAKQMAEEAVAVVGKDARFLEPSAGGGRLVDALADLGVHNLTAVELDPLRCAQLLRVTLKASMLCYCGDFLNFVENGWAHKPVGRRVALAVEEPVRADAVVMNPPFNRGLDVKHVAAAISLQTRSEPGKPWCLRAIMSAGIRFRQDRASAALRAAIECLGGTIEDLPPGTFTEAGTNVNTVLVRIGGVA